MTAIRIEPAGTADIATLHAIRLALWPDAETEAPPIDGIALLARDVGGHAIGFAEATLRRDYVNGCDHRPAAFLEGVFVVPTHRRRGVARALIQAVEDWAGEQGVCELASDAALDNAASHAFHRAAGFVETERVIFYRRSISP